MRAVLASVPVKYLDRVKGLEWPADLCQCSLRSGFFFRDLALGL